MSRSPAPAGAGAGSLAGRVAVVTGGAGGIGSAISLALAEQGAAVVINDFGVTLDGQDPDATPATELAGRIVATGGSAVAHAGSVADFAVAGDLVRTAVETFGRLDILVTSHGILRERMIFNMTEEDWDLVVDVHLKGTFNCVRHATSVMREQLSGSIVCITSPAGLQGAPAQANYAAAKAGIIGLTLSTALAMGKYDVNVNAVAPAAATRMTARLVGPSGALADGAQGDPRTVGLLCAALCAPGARSITGQVFTAAGTKLARWSHPAEVRVAERSGGWSPADVGRDLVEVLGREELSRFDLLGLPKPRERSGE